MHTLSHNNRLNSQCNIQCTIMPPVSDGTVITSPQHCVLEGVDYDLLVPLVEDESQHVRGEDDKHYHREETDGLEK